MWDPLAPSHTHTYNSKLQTMRQITNAEGGSADANYRSDNQEQKLVDHTKYI